ncbi:MAG: hypothetical protein AAFN93_22935 [Bacteroidota bacterium]
MKKNKQFKTQVQRLKRKTVMVFLVSIGVGLYNCTADSSTIKIQHFTHVIEERDGDSYDYYFTSEKLSSVEVEVLKEIFESKKIKYFISNDNQIYYKKGYITSVEMAFILDREMIDSIIVRELPMTPFVIDLYERYYR